MPLDIEPIRLAPDGLAIEIIDQTVLPHRFTMVRVDSLDAAARAIAGMQVRGAPLIGATAAFGVWLGLAADASDAGLARAVETLRATRPTAVNLFWALETMRSALAPVAVSARVAAAKARALAIADADRTTNAAIGRHGLAVFEARASATGHGRSADRPLQVLTHCNAGWLAAVAWGTATAPIYTAARAGMALHVWVDETRPRNQGASLTAWELGRAGIPHTVIADNAGGHLMQRGAVDLCIVGADRVTATGDVCNKIGTYLKALAAADTRVPFYAAVPSSTIDWTIADGLGEIPIEARSVREVTHIRGRDADGVEREVQVTPDGSPAANPGFDVTPARLVTAILTERGAAPATRAGLAGLFPEHARAA